MSARFVANSELSAQSQALFAAYDRGDMAGTVACSAKTALSRSETTRPSQGERT